MEPKVELRLDKRLEEAGEALELTGALDQKDLEMGERKFSLPQGIAYDLVLTHTGEAILASGTTQALVVGECDRCLGEARLVLQGTLEALYALPGREFDPELQEDIETYPIINNVIDLTFPMVASIAVEIPFKVLCAPDCKGLCPICGQNLNEGSCDCAARQAQDDLSHPFAILRTLHWDEEHGAQQDAETPQA